MKTRACGLIAPRGYSRRGFTLIEVIVAVTILAVGLLASASVMGAVAHRERLSTSRIALMTIGDNKMEELRAFATTRSADTVQLAVGGSHTVPEANHADTVTAPDGREYLRTWIVTAGPVGTRSVHVLTVPLAILPYETRRVELRALVQIF